MFYKDDQLKQMGFTSGETVEESIIDINTGKRTVKRGRKWSANGFFPEIHDDNTEYNYNKMVTGSGEAANKIYGAYGANPIHIDPIEQKRNRIETDKLKEDLSLRFNDPRYNNITASRLDPVLTKNYGTEMHEIVVGSDTTSFVVNRKDGIIYRKSDLYDGISSR